MRNPRSREHLPQAAVDGTLVPHGQCHQHAGVVVFGQGSEETLANAFAQALDGQSRARHKGIQAPVILGNAHVAGGAHAAFE